MRRRANYLIPLLAAIAFVTVRLLSPNTNFWTGDSPVRVILGAIFVALISFAVSMIIDWIADRNRRLSNDSRE